MSGHFKLASIWYRPTDQVKTTKNLATTQELMLIYGRGSSRDSRRIVNKFRFESTLIVFKNIARCFILTFWELADAFKSDYFVFAQRRSSLASCCACDMCRVYHPKHFICGFLLCQSNSGDMMQDNPQLSRAACYFLFRSQPWWCHVRSRHDWIYRRWDKKPWNVVQQTLRLQVIFIMSLTENPWNLTLRDDEP